MRICNETVLIDEEQFEKCLQVIFVYTIWRSLRILCFGTEATQLQLESETKGFSTMSEKELEQLSKKQFRKIQYLELALLLIVYENTARKKDYLTVGTT